MSNKRQIPPVETVVDPRARTALSAVKEQLETLGGIRGNNTDRALTVGDLVTAGLIQCDSKGTVVKKEEDTQVKIQDQSLLDLESSIVAIATVDVGAAPALYLQAYAQSQTDLLNEIKAKVNEIIADIKTGKFKQ